jgi:hypothetical protein
MAWTESLTQPVGASCLRVALSTSMRVRRASSLKAVTVMVSSSDGPISPASRDTLVTPFGGNLSKNEGPINGSVLMDLVPSQGTSVKEPRTTPLVVLLGPISMRNPRALYRSGKTHSSDTTVPDSKEWNRILNFSSLRLRCMYGVRIFNAYPVERVLHGSVAWSAVCTST